MFPHEFHFPGYLYNLVGYVLNRDTIMPPIGSVIVDFLGPTNIASRKAMIRTIPCLFVRVYLTSLSIVLVVQLYPLGPSLPLLD